MNDKQLEIVNGMQMGVPHQMIPTNHEMIVLESMARIMSESKMYRHVGDINGVMAIMLAAREFGVPPVAALNGGLQIINGKVELSARVMTAMIRRAGHSFQVKKLDDKECVVIGRRCDNGDTLTCSYHIDEAKQAGLVKSGGGWVKNPKDMLFARAVSRMARQLFSDVIGVGYIEGELPRAVECEVLPAEEIDKNSIANEIEQFLNQFEEREEKFLWLEYIQVVCTHYGWTQSQAIEEFNKDMQQTKEKFEKWKKKSYKS